MPGLNSFNRSCAGSHYYGKEYKIWADFGLVGNTENEIWEKRAKSSQSIDIYLRNFYTMTLAWTARN